jgi:ribosome biogenesis GTPase
LAEELASGIVVKALGGHYYVRVGEETVDCGLRGRLKRSRLETDLVAVGDRVRMRHLAGGRGVIEEVLPRRTALSRRAVRLGVEAEQVLVANPNQIVIVFSVREPTPRLRMLDRFLVIAEVNELPAVICANKIDLADEDEPQAIFGVYEDIGYEVLYTSAVTGEGVDALREVLVGRLSVLAGPSGVGKSSLLNVVEPGLGQHVRETSQKTGKGKHATVVPEIIPLSAGGYVADTPGVKALALWDLVPEELDAHFPEMRSWVVHCHYPGCSHIHEPNCAVQAAVERGEISPARYDSYVRMHYNLAETDWWE